MNSSQNFVETIGGIVESNGISWRGVLEVATEVVVFGSWAVSMNRKESDVDLLCVGEGKRTKSASVDIVWTSSDSVNAKKWLGSELANHIAKYGIWILGEGRWKESVYISDDAIQFKKYLIETRVATLEKVWNTLDDNYRVKHVVKVRRDIQRLCLMMSGRAVEASPMLDKRWANSGRDLKAFSEILETTQAGNLVSAAQRNLVSPFLSCLDWRR